MTTEGILAGFGVMISWGIADFIQSIPIRKIGTPKTIFIRNSLTILFVGAMALYFYFDKQIIIKVTDFLVIITSSIAYIFGYYMFMKGFEIGNVSLVSPIGSSYSIITVLLALLFLNEKLPAVKLSAICIMIIGVLLTSTDIRKVKSITSQKGLKEALLSMLGLGIAFFILGFASKQMDILNIFIFASLSQAVLFIFLSLTKNGLVKMEEINFKISSIFIIHSLIVNMGWFFYIYGIGKNLVSLVTPLSSLFPAITIILALIFYKEKLVMNQKAGIISILFGVYMISI